MHTVGDTTSLMLRILQIYRWRQGSPSVTDVEFITLSPFSPSWKIGCLCGNSAWQSRHTVRKPPSHLLAVEPGCRSVTQAGDLLLDQIRHAAL